MKSVIAMLLFIAGSALCSGCGGAPDKGVDTDQIRRNADDADRDLDRESQKQPD